MHRRTVLAIAAGALTVTPLRVLAGDLSSADARRALDTLERELGGYIDPVLGEKARAAVRAGRKRYLVLGDREAFAEAVSVDLLAATGDLHLKLSVDTVSPQVAALSEVEEQLLEGRLAHGLMTIRRLPGNIGYFKLRYFAADEAGADLIDAGLRLLKDADALILDLRENTGGGGASDARLLGHLSRGPIPMAVIQWRQPDGAFTTEARRADIPAGGPLYPDKPVFVLIAKRTFSAAEAVAYDLQAAKRAVIVGERSRGGANPSNRPVSLGAGLSVFLPNGRVVHPVTGGNWDGVGVTPDVPTPPREALTEAFRRALAAARPTVSTPKSEKELADARADPKAALDEML
ncbi:MAG: S41 family peptidase [Caulobacter sp.]|nr:S41 family peptidase [Caulobacter sp.]